MRVGTRKHPIEPVEPEQAAETEVERLRRRVAELEAALAENPGVAEGVRAREAMFQDLIEGSVEGIVIQRDYKPLFANQAYAEMHGYDSPEEVMGMDTILALVAPEEHERFLEYRRAREKGKPAPTRYDFQALHKNGSRVWLESVVTEITWEGKPAVLATLYDISDRKQAENALRESEQRFRDFAEAASDWFWEMDAELRFVYLSDRIYEASGVTPEFHYGKTRRDIGVPDDEPEKWDKHLATLDAHEPFTNFTYRRLGPDGNISHIRISGIPIFDEDSVFKGYRGVGSEMTAEVHAQEALRDSEARLKAIIDNSPFLIALKDIEGRCVLANRRYSQIFGVDENEIRGKTVFDIFDRKNAQIYWDHERRVLETGEASEEEFLNATVDGERVLLENKFPIHDNAGKVVGLGFIGADITERKRAEEQFRSYFNLPLVGAAINTPDGRWREVNDKLCEILGYSREELLQMTASDVTHPDDAEESRTNFEETRDGKRDAYNIEKRYLRKDGSLVHCALSAQCIRRPDGSPDYFIALIQDITERKQAEDALRDSEERFRDFADVASDWFWEMDPDLRFSYFSERVAQVHGLPSEHYIGMRRAEIGMDLIDTATGEEHLALLARHEPFRNFTYPVRGKEEMLRYVRTSGKPLFDDGGNFLGYRGTATDVTSEMEARLALKDSEERFRDVAEASSDWFWEMDENLRFSYFSDRLTRITGLDPKNLIGKTRQEIGWRDADAKKWRKHLEDLEAHRPFRDFRYTYMGQDDRIQHWTISGKPVLDDRGDFKGYRGTGTDVTVEVTAQKSQRDAKEQAETANRAKSEFLANMSHELRTPLNAIIGFSEMMRDEILGPIGGPHYKQYAKDVHESGTHLLSIINDILDLSKVEAGKFELEEEDVDIVDAIAASARIIQPRANDADVTVKLDVPRDFPYLRADLRAIKQILLNLLSNAVKFTEPGGQVTVKAQIENDGSAVLAVADNGIGMTPEDIPTALSSFGQIDSAYTRQHQGTGLGLPLVKALVEAHGATFDLESEVGKGTTAVMRFAPEKAVRRPLESTRRPASA